jgi:hypothetical protein
VKAINSVDESFGFALVGVADAQGMGVSWLAEAAGVEDDPVRNA